jgi:hypothetical protein
MEGKQSRICHKMTHSDGHPLAVTSISETDSFTLLVVRGQEI